MSNTTPTTSSQSLSTPAKPAPGPEEIATCYPNAEVINWTYDPSHIEDPHLVPAYATPQSTRLASVKVANATAASIRSLFRTSDQYVPASTNTNPKYITQPNAQLPLSISEDQVRSRPPTRPSTPSKSRTNFPQPSFSSLSDASPNQGKSSRTTPKPSRQSLTSKLTFPSSSESNFTQLISSPDPFCHYYASNPTPSTSPQSTLPSSQSNLLSPAIEAILASEVYINDTMTRLALCSSKVQSCEYQLQEARTAFPSIAIQLYSMHELTASLQLLQRGQNGMATNSPDLDLSLNPTHGEFDDQNHSSQSLEEQVVGQYWLDDDK